MIWPPIILAITATRPAPTGWFDRVTAPWLPNADPGIRLALALGAMLVGLTILIVAVAIARRALIKSQDIDLDSGVFTIGDLKKLRRDGHITDHEFERAKARIVANGIAAYLTDEESDASQPPDSPPEKKD